MRVVIVARNNLDNFRLAEIAFDKLSDFLSRDISMSNINNLDDILSNGVTIKYEDESSSYVFDVVKSVCLSRISFSITYED